MNAKEELLKILQEKDLILKCANIIYDRYYVSGFINFSLKIGYTITDVENFFDSLDFIYDNGYGSQELFGIVWCSDNSWLEREEYDGLENWTHKTLPEIPKELL